MIEMNSAYELGRALNPRLVEQQLVGGAWMGLSHAIYETTEPYYPDRRHGPRDFNEYLMPGPGDICPHHIAVLERPAPDGPFGGQLCPAQHSDLAGGVRNCGHVVCPGFECLALLPIEPVAVIDGGDTADLPGLVVEDQLNDMQRHAKARHAAGCRAPQVMGRPRPNFEAPKGPLLRCFIRPADGAGDRGGCQRAVPAGEDRPFLRAHRLRFADDLQRKIR